MTYVDLHTSLPELESTCDLNREKNATRYECLTKSERLHFLENTLPFVGTSLGAIGALPE